MGGYFIVNGNEKVLRLLITPRKSFVSYSVLGLQTCHGNLENSVLSWKVAIVIVKLSVKNILSCL